MDRRDETYTTDPAPAAPAGTRRFGGMSGWTIASWVFAFASILFGLLTAIVGAICALVGRSKGDPRAQSALVTNVLIGVLSVVIGLFFVS